MKKTAFLLALCLAVTVLFGACGAKDVAVNEPQTDGVSLEQDTAADTQSGAMTQDVQQDASVPAQEGSSAAAATQAAGDPAKAGTAETSSAAAAQSGSSAAAATPEQGVETVPTDPAKAEGTTAAKQADTTAATKQSASSEQSTTAAPAGGSGNTIERDGTPNKTTRPAVTKPSTPSGTTAVSTTQYVPAKGNRVEAKKTYLKEAAVTYVSALNEQDLERFNITGDKAKEILKNKNDWAAYTIQIDFRNDETMPVTIYYLDVTEGNGDGDVWINGDLAGDLGLSPGAKMTERFYVLAKKSDADGKVLNQLQKMKMQVQYAATPEDDMVTPTFVYADVT